MALCPFNSGDLKMQIHRFVGLLAAAGFLVLAPVASQAAQSYDNCTGYIDSLPVVISKQGTWCLRGDVSTAMTYGNAVDVQANNVTIDCNDFKLGGLAAGPATVAFGITASNRSNVSIRHCSIRGFNYGILFNEGGGHVIEDNRFDGNTSVAIALQSDDSTIRRNLIFSTGGSVSSGYAQGILTNGNVDILDNTISGVTAHSDGRAVGIGAGSSSGSISGNRIRGLVAESSGYVKGIFAFGSLGLTITDNRIVGDMGDASMGLDCDMAFYKARAKDNIIYGFSNAMSSCADAGGNDTGDAP